MTDFGHFAGGVVNQRNTNRQLGLQRTLVEVQENQLNFNQRIEQRNAVTEAVAKTVEQIRWDHRSRVKPGRHCRIVQEGRKSIERLGVQAEAANIGFTAADFLATYDRAALTAQTRTEVAQAEAQSNVAGAQATVEGIAGLPPEQQARVGQLLGLTDPIEANEFYRNLASLDDPSLTPEQREFVVGRLNKQTTDNQLGLVFSSDGQGNISVAQVPASEAGMAAKLMGTGGQMDALRSQSDQISRGRSIAQALIGNSAPLGIKADVRDVGERVTGAVADLLGVPLSEFNAGFEELTSLVPHDDPTTFSIGELTAAEGFLLFSVARALQPDGNRLLAATLDRARRLTDLGGITSDEEVRRRLSTIDTILESAETDVSRRQQQLVGGSTDIERVPPISGEDSATEPVDETDDLIRQLDEILGG